jgi:hypothetical protein
MKSIKYVALPSMSALSFAAALALTSTPAQAQATRTWVSGVGDDVNPCSRTAPCKTFAGAISKTAVGGEINCLDPAGFGAVTITKSLTISCPYTEGGALAGGNGIVVNLPAVTDVVFLRGLDIFGVNPPANGIRMIGQGSLHVEDSTIRRFNAANSFGISFQPSGGAMLYVSNTTVADNGNGATGGGILVQPTGAGGNGKVSLKNVRALNNASNGLKVDSTGNTNASGMTIGITDSQFDGNGNGITAINAAGTNPVAIMLANSTLNNNVGAGLIGNGSSMAIRVKNTTITGNALGITSFGGSTIATYGNNSLIGNPTNGAANNGAFTGPVGFQ